MCASDNMVTRSGLVDVERSAVGLRFFAELNNTSGAPVAVRLRPDECCLDGDARCTVLQLTGSAATTVPEGTPVSGVLSYINN